MLDDASRHGLTYSLIELSFLVLFYLRIYLNRLLYEKFNVSQLTY